MTKPREQGASRAVALAYQRNDQAPRVTAKGGGITAAAIIEKARCEGIYVHQSPELVGLLMQVDLDARIPESLYTTIAELLVWVYQLDQCAAAGLQSETSGKGS